jgi:hypothetical protein
VPHRPPQAQRGKEAKRPQGRYMQDDPAYEHDPPSQRQKPVDVMGKPQLACIGGAHAGSAIGTSSGLREWLYQMRLTLPLSGRPSLYIASCNFLAACPLEGLVRSSRPTSSPGHIQGQAQLSPRLGFRQPKSSYGPLMSWASASSPLVMDQNPPRPRAFNRCEEGKAYVKLRSVAITCTPLRSP